MRNTPKLAIAACLAAAALGFTAPAQAATTTPTSMHRGSTGCFNWSWADGDTTTTIYYSNTCSTTKQLNVTWKSGLIKRTITFTVARYSQGHHKDDGAIVAIQAV